MQIQKAQNNCGLNQTFTAKMVDTYALRKLKTKMSAEELDIFEKCMKDIENINDGKFFEYRPVIVGNNMIAKIHRLDKNGTAIDPPMFINCGDSKIDVFSKMADWYSCMSKVLK